MRLVITALSAALMLSGCSDSIGTAVLVRDGLAQKSSITAMLLGMVSLGSMSCCALMGLRKTLHSITLGQLIEAVKLTALLIRNFSLKTARSHHNEYA